LEIFDSLGASYSVVKDSEIPAMDFSDMENGLIAGLSDGISYLYRTTNGGYDFEPFPTAVRENFLKGLFVVE